MIDALFGNVVICKLTIGLTQESAKRNSVSLKQLWRFSLSEIMKKIGKNIFFSICETKQTSIFPLVWKERKSRNDELRWQSENVKNCCILTILTFNVFYVQANCQLSHVRIYL